MLEQLRRVPLALASILALVPAPGCVSYRAFTDALVVDASLQPAELEHLQYYNSKEIRLRRESSTTTARIGDHHALVLSEGTRIEERIIPAHTPGILVRGGPGRVTVSFEEGASLDFVREDEPSRSSDESERERFASAPEASVTGARSPWRDERYVLPVANGGVVRYAGSDWRIEYDRAPVSLEVRAESIDASDEQSTTVRGLHVDR